MKPSKLVIHLVRHIPTDAEIPVIVNKTDENNVIQDYREFLDNRKGFSLSMLQNRWDLCRDDTIELLQKYEVPGHIEHKNIPTLMQGISPIDFAIFFEEYIFGIEKKENLKHSKLKSKPLKILRDH